MQPPRSIAASLSVLPSHAHQNRAPIDDVSEEEERGRRKGEEEEELAVAEEGAAELSH